MSKKLEHVLAIRANSIVLSSGFSFANKALRNIIDSEAAMYGSRSWLETDENFLQIIPYCVVTSANGNVLAYSRTAQTGEQRLAGKISVGVGGHVNTETLAQRIGAIEPYITIMNSVYRELEEELVFPYDDDLPCIVDFKGLIYDPSNEVGRVHLGLLMECRIDPKIEPVKHKITSEDKGINVLGFFAKEYLLDSDEIELEGWSRIALEAMK